MISQESNDLLTQVGPGTPMGNLMRRYWHPVATAASLEDKPTKKVRLLGEDLVLFKDRLGRVGLLPEYCPHRSVSLVYGIPENEGIRCSYHGWLFGHDGQCLEQPAEPDSSTFKNRIKMPCYLVEELGGLIFAYLGPKPAPLLPRYDMFVWDDAYRSIGYAVIPCNWLQIMENSLDPTHAEWLHGHYTNYMLGKVDSSTRASRRHVKIGFDEFEHGIIKRRVLEGSTEEDDDWRIGHPILFPNMLRTGQFGNSFFQIRVPIDDHHTMHFWYLTYRFTRVTPPKQERIPEYEVRYRNDQGELIVDFTDGQDIMAWITQGRISDRTKERLGQSDKGIIMYRQMLKEQIQRMEQGHDPKNVMRDPEKNRMIDIPQEYNKGQFIENVINMRKSRERYNPRLPELVDLLERDGKRVVPDMNSLREILKAEGVEPPY